MEFTINCFAWFGLVTCMILFAITAGWWALWAYEKLPGVCCIHVGNFTATLMFVTHWLWHTGDTENVKRNAGTLLYQRFRELQRKQPEVAARFIELMERTKEKEARDE